MSKRLCFVFLLAFSVVGHAQVKKELNNTVGISIPVIGNNSEATFYRLGSPIYPAGKSISYGLNINYTRTLYKGIYGIAGIGYFKQSFRIKRPFNYDDPVAFLFSTDSYKYDNAQLFIGLGYKQVVSKTVCIKADIAYNLYYSFRQKYYVSPVSDQINHKFICIGKMLNFNIGLDRTITQKISLGIGAILPMYTHWNDDETFIKYDYSDDTQQIARTKFSIGGALTCNYHF